MHGVERGEVGRGRRSEYSHNKGQLCGAFWATQAPELELPRREGRDRNSKLNKQPHWKPVQRIVRHSFWLYGRGFLEAKLAG